MYTASIGLTLARNTRSTRNSCGCSRHSSQPASLLGSWWPRQYASNSCHAFLHAPTASGVMQSLHGHRSHTGIAT